MRGFKNFKVFDARCPSIHFLFYDNNVRILNLRKLVYYANYLFLSLAKIHAFYEVVILQYRPFWYLLNIKH